jgi:hypothetical protein
MPTIKTSLFLLFIVSCPIVLKGQIQRGSADFSDTSDYRIANLHDSLFIFLTDNPDKYIEARSPGGDTVDFEWSVYDSIAKEYILLSAVHDKVSRIDIDKPDGYRVLILGPAAGDTTISRCWVLFNDFNVNIIGTDSIEQDGEWIKTIPDGNKWCHLIPTILAVIDSSSMVYFHPESGTRYTLSSNYPVTRGNWTANPEATESGINHFLNNDDFWLNVSVQNPYWEDSWYRLKVTDQYGVDRSDSVFNETIEPHADFAYRYIRLDDREYYPDRSDNYYTFYGSSIYGDAISAPAQFLFSNLSINADTMVWYFGDKQVAGSGSDTILHTYELPGSYQPKLIAFTMPDYLLVPCADTFPRKDEELDTNDYPLVVDEASIEHNDSTILPNVFSCPSGDYNVFRFVADVSITDFEIVIHNRYGKRVYHYEGNIRDWEGWDGRDKSTDNYVETGVYYYTVKKLNVLPEFETGREVRLKYYYLDKVKDEQGKKKPIPSIYRGFVHVYNSE